MRGKILHFFIYGSFLANSLMASTSTLWEGSTEDIAQRLRSHETYIRYEDLKIGFLPVLNTELHADFEIGFGAMLLKHEAGCDNPRLPIKIENSHLACLYEDLTRVPELDMQKTNLYARLNIPAHLKYYTPDFVGKIQS